MKARRTRKKRVVVHTYKAPFVEEQGMVLDAMGYVVAQFQEHEEILVGKTSWSACEVVVRALNEYCGGVK